MFSLFWKPSFTKDMSKIRYFEILNNLHKANSIQVLEGCIADCHFIGNFLEKCSKFAFSILVTKIHLYQFCDKFCVGYNRPTCFAVTVEIFWCIRSFSNDTRNLRVFLLLPETNNGIKLIAQLFLDDRRIINLQILMSSLRCNR